VDRHLGYSDWTQVTDERVKQFADVTGDHQWIHFDSSRTTESRFGVPIVHGYLILALTSSMLRQVLPKGTSGMRVNYGCDRVRFFTPVPVGAYVRLGATVRSVKPVRGGAQVSLSVVVTVREQRVPACVARVILLTYD
jgi:acyl dehydratase